MNSKQFEDLKKGYQDIRASEGAKKRIHNILAKRGSKRRLITVAASFAIIAATAIGVLNAAPTLAKELAEKGKIGSVVHVLTFGRYKLKDGNFTADVTVPKIEGLFDKELQDKINDDFKENAKHIIAAFEKDYTALKEQFPDAHMGVEYNYQILTDNEDFLAIDIYLFNVVGSSSTVHEYYTIDKKTGQVLTLPGLFKKDAQYADILSAYILSDMKRQNDAGENMFWLEDSEFTQPFEKIDPNQHFYINSSGSLVICFDKYQVAPGSSGSPEFIIPDDIIRDILL